MRRETEKEIQHLVTIGILVVLAFLVLQAIIIKAEGWEETPEEDPQAVAYTYWYVPGEGTYFVHKNEHGEFLMLNNHCLFKIGEINVGKQEIVYVEDVHYTLPQIYRRKLN